MIPNPIPRRPEVVTPELHAANVALHKAIHHAVAVAEDGLGLSFAAGEVVAMLSRRGMFAEAAELAQHAAKHRALQDEWYTSALTADRAAYADFVKSADADPDYLHTEEP
jgi:hypothetical protein